eukprot:scaffold311603_cov35-Tisochrysis_lutea.AAC.1
MTSLAGDRDQVDLHAKWFRAVRSATGSVVRGRPHNHFGHQADQRGAPRCEFFKRDHPAMATHWISERPWIDHTIFEISGSARDCYPLDQKWRHSNKLKALSRVSSTTRSDDWKWNWQAEVTTTPAIKTGVKGSC